jgi:hypothetical protein
MLKENRESSKKQRQLIAMACGHFGIGKTDKQVMLMTRYGVSSTTELTYAQAEEVIDDYVRKGFVIKSEKRPYFRRQRPVAGAHRKKTGKVTAMATPAELEKIDALAGLIAWRAENGMVKWMRKRFKISQVKTSRDAFVVIEGLKGMFENQMKKAHGPDWWLADHEDVEICFYIAEHFPHLVAGAVVPAYARVMETA